MVTLALKVAVPVTARVELRVDAPSTMRVPLDLRRSWAWTTLPEAVPMISREVPEKEEESEKTEEERVRPWPAEPPVESVDQLRTPALSVLRTLPEAAPSEAGKV